MDGNMGGSIDGCAAVVFWGGDMAEAVVDGLRAGGGELVTLGINCSAAASVSRYGPCRIQPAGACFMRAAAAIT